MTSYHYVIDQGHDGRTFSKKDQVKMCGNLVSPWPMMALIKANMDQEKEEFRGIAT
jgi:DNA (cytosine-5)-methyltransferase 1